jgi:hypothetical protein
MRKAIIVPREGAEGRGLSAPLPANGGGGLSLSAGSTSGGYIRYTVINHKSHESSSSYFAHTCEDGFFFWFEGILSFFQNRVPV